MQGSVHSRISSTPVSGAPTGRDGSKQAGTSYVSGPMRVDAALERIQALRAHEPRLLASAWSSVDAGRLHAMKGEIGRARALWSDGRQVYLDAGLLMTAATFAQGGAEIAFRAGDLEGEEAVLRDSLEILEGIGERGFYSTQALFLSECLYRAGAEDTEIEALCTKARESTAPTISSTSSGSTWSAGCFTHGAARPSKPRSAHVERWRWPKQATSTTRGRIPVRTSPRSWRCPVGAKRQPR